MPPHRKPRRYLTTASFYDKAGAIADGSPQPSPTAATFFWNGGAGRGALEVVDKGADSDDDEYTLTGYGEMSTDDAFMLPPSPTQTIKYRYRAYRPKLARLRKVRSSASKGPLKMKAGGHHSSEYMAILNAYLSGTPGKSGRRDFQALIQKYRDSTADSGQSRDTDAYATSRKGYTHGPSTSATVRRMDS
ncbi:hypothetical protein BN946_scf184985.g28 [Trametes cinnabarina]|uniref:Uncharacterized protein n=1 Tax=Pycnoporus cinnabarinus TaxID=5643 RepID=A0A060SK47_PYCCI|nr:hypothetical protein BN946_scf184985.g28 [Trametes cinnabarina]